MTYIDYVNGLIQSSVTVPSGSTPQKTQAIYDVKTLDASIINASLLITYSVLNWK
jgi:hypothetical protein